MSGHLLNVPIVAAHRLEGPRCLSCTGPTIPRDEGVTCLHCAASYPVTPAGVIEATDLHEGFGHGLDGEIDLLVPVLERLKAPACTEKAIAAYAASVGVDSGNPFWEGRADVARLHDGADGVTVDIGAGFGTIAVALARSAAHVYALDKSSGRARVTAARARAEGLPNVTAVHADGLLLPLGSATCDLALLIGVLEWTGFGHDDPVASQEAVLAEVSRVLKWGGTLLIGIENRYGAHYLLGGREEHTSLRFSSLLPRTVANAYCRLLQGRKMTTYTYSRRALVELVRHAGLEPRIGIALPTYSEPQLSFDLEDFDVAWGFYLRHLFSYSSASRRVLGALGRRLPARFYVPIAPTFWVAASKGRRPERIPTVITGSGDCAADIKIVDWKARQILRFARSTAQLEDRVDLIEGWSARNWVCSPLLRRNRLKRQKKLLQEATSVITARQRRPATEEVREASLGQAFAGMEQIGAELRPATLDWCHEQLSSLSSGDFEMVVEHTDFATVNLVVETPTLRLRDIDRRSGVSFGLGGIDAVVLATDLLCSGRNVKDRNLDVALSRMFSASAELSREIGRLLWADFGIRTSVPGAVALTVGAVLRYTANNGRVPGLVSFLERSASGELESALHRVRPDETVAGSASPYPITG
jgi:ubiquinone/menaquinone biosynthesis C-methylase UbiE